MLKMDEVKVWFLNRVNTQAFMRTLQMSFNITSLLHIQ